MRLNPHLDLASAAQRFRTHGRAVIENILEPMAADQLHTQLEGSRDWELCVHGQSGPEAIDPDALARSTPEQQRALQAGLRRQARAGFAFLYLRQDLIPGDPPAFSDIRDLVASAEFLNLLRAASDDSGIVRVDGQLTLYQEGCFLKQHDDTYSGKDRRVAYVLNLTRDWQADWGGLLHFTDSEGRVQETIVPRFNSLALFRVPAPHFVSMVANYALGNRLTVTGWGFGP